MFITKLPSVLKFIKFYNLHSKIIYAKNYLIIILIILIKFKQIKSHIINLTYYIFIKNYRK